MSYLKPELNNPVRVKWNGESPNFDTAKQYPRHAYNVEVDGKPMVFEATESTHEKIQQFSKMNGNEFVIVKRPNPKYPNGTIYNIEPFDITNSPQNAPMYNQSHSEYKKSQPPTPQKEEAPDWDKITEEKDDKILKGQARNQSVALFQGKEDLPSKNQLTFKARQLYWMWKEMSWEKELPIEKPLPAKEEAPPVGDTDFIGDTSLPF
ncbi:hypothetical protein HN682_08230 [Candidatus Peregrinibacteria bacterium]|nr:hypothetical protein [Candidatus Peregrinibacteria bacterium]